MTLATVRPSMPRHLSFLSTFRAGVCLSLLFLVSAVTRGEKTDQLKPQGYVNDFAGVLSESAKVQLTALCTEVDQKAHAQIAVVTVKSLDGRPVEDFTIDLATKWGVGPKQSASGVMILLAINDHASRIEVGYGLEPILPDGRVGSFLSEAVPLLRNSDYDGALLLITRRVADVIASDRGVTLTGASPRPAQSRGAEDRVPGLWGRFFLILFAILVFYAILKGISSSGGGFTRGGGSGWWIGPMIGSGMGGGRGGWGGGGFGGGGGGGGGFGGFGGGSFGGGGASGSW